MSLKVGRHPVGRTWELMFLAFAQLNPRGFSAALDQRGPVHRTAGGLLGRK
jgi:hypothetical protein